MIQFVQDDQAYLAWVHENQNAFVLNTRQRPDPNYLVLHRSTCRFIASNHALAGAWTERGYRKIGCNDLAEVRNAVLAAGRSSGEPTGRCSHCMGEST